MAKIAWGKPRLFTKNADVLGSSWSELPTPVEDSTELTPTKGDKLEAKIEGGENEDVKYKRSTYNLVFNIRKAKDREAPFPSVDGIVSDHFAIMLQPEDPTVEGFYIEASTVSVDETFTASDGAMWQVTMEAVKAQTGNTVKWGIVTAANPLNGSDPTFTEGPSGVEPTFTAVSTSSSGYSSKNPSNEGWYESTGTSPNVLYRLTWDTTPVDGKTYYKKS